MISEARKLSFEEAYMLASLIVDVGVSQLVDPNLTANAKIPKRYLA